MTAKRVLMPKDCFPRTLDKLKVDGGNQIWRNERGDRLFAWDESHGGEVEVYNKRGKHVGVMNCLGIMIKDAVKGRSINV